MTDQTRLTKDDLAAIGDRYVQATAIFRPPPSNEDDADVVDQLLADVPRLMAEVEWLRAENTEWQSVAVDATKKAIQLALRSIG